MPEAEKRRRPLPHLPAVRGPERPAVDVERFWIQGAQSAVERDMGAHVTRVRIAQVFGPLEADAAVIEVSTDHGAYQVVVSRDGTFTVF